MSNEGNQEMRIEEAKQILNKNGYLLKEDAFRNNTDMSSICAIMDAHGWSPEFIIERIKDYYYNVYLKPKSIKSTKLKCDYVPPKKDDWLWNNENNDIFSTSEIIDTIIKESEINDILICVKNFYFYPYYEKKNANVCILGDDNDEKWLGQLYDTMIDACEKVSSKSKYFNIICNNFIPWHYDTWMAFKISIEPKNNIKNIDKKILINELNNIINDIVTDKELNKVEYDAVSAALKAEEEL